MRSIVVLFLILALSGCTATTGELSLFGVTDAPPVANDDDAAANDDDAVGDDDNAVGDDDDAVGDDDDVVGDDDDSVPPINASAASMSGALSFVGDDAVGQIQFSYWADADAQLVACEQVFSVEMVQELAPADCALCSSRLELVPGSVTDISAQSSQQPCLPGGFSLIPNLGRLFLNDLNGGGDFLTIAFVPDSTATSQGLDYLSSGGYAWWDFADAVVASGFEPVGMGFIDSVGTYVGAADSGGALASSGPGEPWAAFLAYYAAAGDTFTGPTFEPNSDYFFSAVFYLGL